jgi:hypothetical protein
MVSDDQQRGVWRPCNFGGRHSKGSPCDLGAVPLPEPEQRPSRRGLNRGHPRTVRRPPGAGERRPGVSAISRSREDESSRIVSKVENRPGPSCSISQISRRSFSHQPANNEAATTAAIATVSPRVNNRGLAARPRPPLAQPLTATPPRGQRRSSSRSDPCQGPRSRAGARPPKRALRPPRSPLAGRGVPKPRTPRDRQRCAPQR